MPTTQQLSHNILVAALAGLKIQQQQIEEQIAEVESMLGGSSRSQNSTSSNDSSTGRGRRRSAAVRHRMAEAQKARWAKIRGESASDASGTTAATKPKRKLSAAGRRAIVTALKKRWAAKRAAEAGNSVSAKRTAANKAGRKSMTGRVAKSGPSVRNTPPRKAVAKKAPPAPTTMAAGAGQ